MNDHSKPSILFATSEMFPLAKTGGLADVSAALPATLSLLGVDIRTIIPGYPGAMDCLVDRRIVCALDDIGGRLIEGTDPCSGLKVYLYDEPSLYDRNGSLYQDPNGADWYDNHRRYAAFCHAASRIACGSAGLGWQPDIVHANDWHTGLLPAILSARDAGRPATLFTIHNLAFQGNFDATLAPDLGLPDEMLTSEGIEFYGKLSFLKAGLRYADKLTTVSPTYAREVLTPEFGCGMDGLLRARAEDLTGILNGVDYSIWDPATDEALPHRYGVEDLSGKDGCKAAIREELGLDPSSAPLLIFVNRITQQKMADVLLAALPALIASGIQVAIHGQGDRTLEEALSAQAQNHGGRIAVDIGYDEQTARRLTAAADLSLTASRFEPCGLTTMYAMRYGALPVTRHVGGVADTVVDADEALSGGDEATGFVFAAESADEMLACIERAEKWYGRRDWSRVQRSAMRRDFGWERSARRYLELYRSLRPEAFEKKASREDCGKDSLAA
ncbi:MAG TPA: glycogen synthase GlgA [Alphaproteobacteria bacterium]|nr:glycogen synthase GlgA [Alphaproteobacteria bacterium]